MVGLLVAAAVIAAPVLIWLIFRGHGYKRTLLEAPPGADWEPTGERFIDQHSGQEATVYFHRNSGERAYVRTTRHNA